MLQAIHGMIEVTTQAQLDAALATDPDATVTLGGDGPLQATVSGEHAPTFLVRGAVEFRLAARDQSRPRVEASGAACPHILARDHSRPQLLARDRSEPRIITWSDARPKVEARDASRPFVTANGSGQPEIEAWGESRPFILARDNSQPQVDTHGRSHPRILARDNSHPWVVTRQGSRPSIVARHDSHPRVEARDSSRPRIEAHDDSEPSVEAGDASAPALLCWDESRPRLRGHGTSRPRIRASGGGQLRVEALEESRPVVEAAGFVQLSLLGHGIVARTTATVALLIDGGAVAEGGRAIPVRRSTPQEWCDYYGVPVADGIAILYKAIDDGFVSPYGGDYRPGSVPEAPDWDGGMAERGGGLHFAPTPAVARSFHDEASRFVGCPVALADMIVHADATAPKKIKASRCCGPVFEVDEDGVPTGRQA